MERKKAIEVIKKNWPDSSFTMLREALETVIPELKESGYDRIRKALINGFNKLDKSAVWYNGITNGQILAWLEKLCEQKPVNKPKFKVGDLIKYTNHNKQPIYKVNHIDKECYICTSDDTSLGDKSVMHFAFDNPYLRLVEQKPAEWSEEDEDILNYIINHFKFDIECTEDDIIRFLKSLKIKVVPQKQWKPSEEQFNNTSCTHLSKEEAESKVWKQ